MSIHDLTAEELYTLGSLIYKQAIIYAWRYTHIHNSKLLPITQVPFTWQAINAFAPAPISSRRSPGRTQWHVTVVRVHLSTFAQIGLQILCCLLPG